MGEGPLALSQSSASSTDRECVTRKTRNLYSQERQAERILQVSPLTVLSGDYGSLGTLHAQAFSGVSLLSGRNTSSPVRSAFAAPVVSNLMSSADLANGPSFPSSSGQPGITTEHPPPALIDRLLLLLVLSTERPQTRQERGKANGKNSFPLFFENSFTFKRRQSETSLTRAGYENSSQVLVLVIKIFVIVLGFLSWCWIRRKKAKEHVT
ncbi:uncharacterized protein LOC101679005 isoform X3 [Mustela putorius furo]|uniref:Uncharacterized protein LOC101679005 isoform X3 n=1 Tax=Mustela putorius furo TaxID=9669 RepID=A0A8U0SGX6_MUSPF|nr:uncharacterized protein LOC101679005 isoform X3 [Mustela putorius furo]